MISTKKIEEGQELIRQAEKSLKTSLLKWRPDYEVAADEYQKAATCFRLAKSYDQCKDCFHKAADCHKQARSWFHAAKCYEQIILILKETNNLTQVEEFANRACHLYQQHGSPESAASALDKAAKVLEANSPEAALRLYQHAIEVVMNEDSTRQAAEYASKISRLMVKLGMYDQAADALRREIGLNQQTESYGAIGRLAVVLVLVQLARGDNVAAEKAFKEWGNCCDVQEVQTLEMLLQAFDDEDPDAAKQALASPFIRSMDVEYSRLARDLPLPKASYKSPNAGNPAPSAGDSAPPTIEDDMEEGGLC
ncbi:unnamed protein product [Hermetia illucens]|uniref:Gamma-soluble NSF attachment protein n=1 Tax=Hermetia illucens TaxID=343691 RepID=A0A7R8UD25_HERIL|nr:unnamed protein product [Hermetia illucens]